MAIVGRIEGVSVRDNNNVLFSDWLRKFGYKDRDEFLNDCAVEGKTEDERDAEWDEIKNEFIECVKITI